MPCNCKELEGFDLVMFKAKSYEIKTGKKAAVFVVNKTTPSFTDLIEVSKVNNICCYFTTDGIEHEIVKEIVKEIKEIEVVSEEVISTPKKRRSKKTI